MIAYTHYPTDGRVRLEAETLARWGHEVIFFVLKEQKRARTYTLEGVTVVELNTSKYQGAGRLRYIRSYISFLFLAWFACTRLFLQRGLSAVHVHNMPDFLVVAAIVPRIFGCKLILDVHDTIPETYSAKFNPNSLMFKLLCLEEKLCCAIASKIVCVNHVQLKTMLQRGIPLSKTVTILTMPTFVKHDKRSLEKHGSEFLIVNHGTISVRLGIDLLVRAMVKLVPLVPKIELRIYGRGDDADEIVRLTETLGMNDHVRFCGVVPWEKLPSELSDIDVGVVANRINAASDLMLPSKLIDYVSLGIPAIVPRLRGIEYYFSSDMVTYFDPEDVDSLAAAVLRLYADKTRRNQQAERAKKFLLDYGWNRSHDGLAALYGRPQADRGPEPNYGIPRKEAL